MSQFSMILCLKLYSFLHDPTSVDAFEIVWIFHIRTRTGGSGLLGMEMLVERFRRRVARFLSVSKERI